MRIRIVTNNPAYERGHVYELDDSEAMRLIIKGQAVPEILNTRDERETRTSDPDGEQR